MVTCGLGNSFGDSCIQDSSDRNLVSVIVLMKLMKFSIKGSKTTRSDQQEKANKREKWLISILITFHVHFW